MVICIDVGHLGRTGKLKWDRGAVTQNAKEANVALLYAVIARGLLEAKGHNVYLLSYGTYSFRHTFARKKIKPDIHVQCHLNAGKGSYSLFIHRKKDKEGKRLAEILQSKFKVVETKLKLSKHKRKAINKGDRGYGCLMLGVPSVLFEPMFLDNPKHFNLLIKGDAISIIGKQLAEAISQWCVTLN